MSETKQPQAGEYWQADDGGRVYIIGVKCNGDVIFESRTGSHNNGGQDWYDWHHIPDCTGWDWVPETYPKHYIHHETNQRWYICRTGKSTAVMHNPELLVPRTYEQKWNSEYDDHVTAGRWIEVTKAEATARLTPSETWPKLYETLDGPSTTVAYVRRESKTTFTIVKKDGTETSGFSWLTEDDERKEITEAEAKARLTPPVPNCPDCGEPTAPSHYWMCREAWVTQDRVLYRHGIDQWKLDWGQSWIEDASMGTPKMNGYRDEHGTTLIRCRRKDLPPVPVPAYPPEAFFNPATFTSDKGPYPVVPPVPVPAKHKIPLRVFVRKGVADQNGSFNLLVARDDSPLRSGQYTEVHGLNIYIEDPLASGSGDAAEEDSALG